MKLKDNRLPILIILAIFGLLNWKCLKSTRPGIPEPVRKTIDSSGINKPKLMKAIAYYNQPADSIQRKALYWLLGNMRGNYTIYQAVEDSSGRKYHFLPEDFKNYHALQQKWDSIEKVVGPLTYKADSFWMDPKQINAQFLINNVDEAYKAYTTNPWDKDYSFRQFCRWILPYRCANETVEPFRKHFIKEYGYAVKKSQDKSVKGIALLLNNLINQKVHYKDTYNKEANVQTIPQIERSGYGNFYDINIYKVKVLRSFGIAASLDYTPFLADTSFGYAWTTVFLPNNSELKLEFPTQVKTNVPGRLAKVYRRTFQRIKTSLFAKKNINETTPPFLGDFYYQDITDKNTSKTVQIKSNQETGYYYLDVFNDGGWHPISWARPSHDSVVTFNRMGTGIVYLPVRLEKHRLLPVGSTFILDKEGTQRKLMPNFTVRNNVLLKYTNPYQKVVQGTKYFLYVWKNHWVLLDSYIGSAKGIRTRVPENGLYLLKYNTLIHRERIFVVDSGGRQVFY